MLHRITVATSCISITILMMMMMIMTTLVDCKVIENPNSLQMQNLNSNDVATNRQLSFLTGIGKETSAPNFIRLVVMRFVYGLASSMGVEERLEDLFNGAFVPPNADGDLFGLGGFGGGGGDSDDGGFGDIAAFDGLFDDDAFL